MDRVLAILLIIVLSAGLFAGCTAKSPEPEPEPTKKPEPKPALDPDGPIDGGAIDSSDPNAPKSVESTEIVKFSCRFSTMDVSEPGILGNMIYSLKAVAENGEITGEYSVMNWDWEWETRSLSVDESFMDELQSIIKQYDLAQFNGYSYEVSGLPDDYGATLTVEYASGESIYASDNQNNFLPYDAMEALVLLFGRGSASVPGIIDVSVASEYEAKEISGGWGSVSWPSIELGYLTSFGEYFMPDGCEKLEETLDYINSQSYKRAQGAWDRFGSASEFKELYESTEAIVTRADSAIVSFYERTRRYDDAGQDRELTEIRAYNIDAATGAELEFSDAFNNIDVLPALIASEIRYAYPEQTFYDGMEDFIRMSIEDEDGNISFSLGCGCVHIFADEYILNNEPGGQHITIPYSAYPQLVRTYYSTSPDSWLLPMEYDTTYYIGASDFGVTTHYYAGADVNEAFWEARLVGKSGKTAIEELYAPPLECWLCAAGDRYFIYLRIPTGDASMLTNVYEVTESGIVKLNDDYIELAISADTPLDPGWVRMYTNDPVFTESVILIPYAYWQIGEDGLPELASGAFDLDGVWCRVRESGEYAAANPSEGAYYLEKGQSIRPFQTDKETFLDFITDEGQIVRFEISDYSPEMQLNGGKTLDELFEPDYEE